VIRVLVVEDSLTVRMRIVEVIDADPDLEVVGQAGDGAEAIALCEKLRPDVMTLDMILPVMSGLAVTEHVMAFCPTPIVVVSSSTNRGELFKTYDALAAGAVDVLDKPSGSEPDDAWEKRLVAVVKLVSRIKVITHPRARLGLRRGGSPAPPGPSLSAAPALSSPWTPLAVPKAASGLSQPRDGYRLVAIGTSTGGPNAMVDVLANLPSAFPLPILLVIHIGRAFAAGFADWLGAQSPLPVSLATDGMGLPEPGRGAVIMAPADVHLVVRGGALRLTYDAERHSCRPSVDVLFESIARELGPSTIACLLTGMGRDGAEGLRAIRKAGGTTIAQDERTSVVFGMPREAIQLGAAERVLPLDRIGPTLSELAVGT
jgi:two-component system chemotaxis response regulator CheB